MIADLVVRELLVRGRDDWVMAADVASVAQDLGGAISDDEIHARSIGAIRSVLCNGLMRIGDVTDGGFLAWEATLEQALDRVERTWRDLGRHPDLGEVCWLENTPKGDSLANEFA